MLFNMEQYIFAQMLNAISDSVNELESAYLKRNMVKFNQLKKEILELQKKIEEAN